MSVIHKNNFNLKNLNDFKTILKSIIKLLFVNKMSNRACSMPKYLKKKIYFTPQKKENFKLNL